MMLRKQCQQRKMSGKQSVKKAMGRPIILTSSARKRKKTEFNLKTNKSRIVLGAEIGRWNSLKERLQLKSHAELATILLNSYESRLQNQSSIMMEAPVTSTPAAAKMDIDKMSDISDISTRSKGWQSDVSGVEFIHYSDDEIPSQLKKELRYQKKYDSSSFVNPFDVSIEVSDEDDSSSHSQDEDSDPDYEPSINISIVPTNSQNLEEITLAEMEFGQEVEVDQTEEEDELEIPGIQRIFSTDDQHQLTDDEAHIIYQEPLLRLARLRISPLCTNQGCGQPVDLIPESVGSALYIKWICRSGHEIYKWCSQPVLRRRLHGGDLLLSAAILLSGNNFTKLALFAKFMRLHFVSMTVFSRIQRTYIVPAIDSFWQDKQTELLEDLRNEQLVLLGDGRMDSPGHCAQYCSYTMMDDNTKHIVSLLTLDKRQTDRKSCNLEKLGFQTTLTDLRRKGCAIAEVVTDAHMQISSIMKKDFPQIKHSHDIWHAAKNIGKKIIKAGQDKQCKDLLPWTQHVTNHFWHAAQTANTYEEFIGIWFGVVHHVCNEHQWVLSYGRGDNACSHGPLDEDRTVEWLKKGSPSHRALLKIVMDKRLMNNVPYYLNFRSTAELENFQNLILMYAAKRFAYSPPVYRARNLLALLDYNEHLNRPACINADGSKRYKRLFNKKSSRWTVVEMKEDKQYGHIPALISRIVSNRIEDREGMQGPAVLEASDPRRLSVNLAPVPPPPTKELALQKKSRMVKDEDKLKSDNSANTVSSAIHDSSVLDTETDF